MGIDINKKSAFGPEGFLISRNNPDGTPPSGSRVLGFYGTVNLSAYATNRAVLGVKINHNTEQYATIDWTAAAVKSAVTVQEIVNAINAAGFSDITASVDTATSRLLVYYSGAGICNFLQVFSIDDDPTIAAELDFGQGQTFGGEGLIYYEAFDNTRTMNLAKRIKDAENIENEAGDGTFIEVTVGAIMKGYNPVITIKDDDYEIKHLIQGGTWTPSESKYKPPLTSQTEKPTFSIIFFSPLFDKGTHERENMAAYLRKDIYSMTGYEGDVTYETKTLQEIIYNCIASEWRNENGVTEEFYQDEVLTKDEFKALNVESIHPITDINT
jgi:hypothetical protein